MTETEIRLELLKLAHSPAREPGAAIDRAKAYEQYVLGEPAKATPAAKTLTLPGKK